MIVEGVTSIEVKRKNQILIIFVDFFQMFILANKHMTHGYLEKNNKETNIHHRGHVITEYKK